MVGLESWYASLGSFNEFAMQTVFTVGTFRVEKVQKATLMLWSTEGAVDMYVFCFLGFRKQVVQTSV